MVNSPEPGKILPDTLYTMLLISLITFDPSFCPVYAVTMCDPIPCPVYIDIVCDLSSCPIYVVTVCDPIPCPVHAVPGVRPQFLFCICWYCLWPLSLSSIYCHHVSPLSLSSIHHHTVWSFPDMGCQSTDGTVVVDPIPAFPLPLPYLVYPSRSSQEWMGRKSLKQK